MKDNILQNFLKESYNANKKQYVINIFNKVRDFIYQINWATTIKKLLDIREWYCVPKTRLLKACYDELAYETKICFISFSFSFIDLPPHLMNWGYSKKPWYHVFLKIKIEDKWIDVDSTWNKELDGTFWSNLEWNGLSSQKVVCNYHEYFVPQNESDEIRIKKELSNDYRLTEDDFKWIAEFNAYIKKISA